MRLSFRIALRFLSTSKAQTLLVALGIGIGIAVQIFIGALIDGLQTSLIDATIGNATHLTIQAKEKNETFNTSPALTDDILKSSPEITALAENITLGAFLQTNDQYAQVLFRGFEMKEANKIYKLSQALAPKSIFPKGNEILIGKKLALDYKINIGDVITIQTANGNKLATVVSGIFDLKVDAINASWVIGTLDLASAIFELEPTERTAIEMQVQKPFDVEVTKANVTALSTFKNLSITDWKEANEQLLSGLTGQSTSSYMIQVFVIISVVLGIASVLAITVLQKSRQLGILKAMGITNSRASQVFLFQGILLGIIGGIIGILIGIGLLYVFQTFALNPDGTPVVPVNINPAFMAFSGLLAVAACTIASLVPARKSKKLSPIEVIRNG